MLRHTLRNAGYDVCEAANGEQALQVYRDEKPDVVIMDIVMPDKEGIETIREIKQADPAAKIIAISGGGRLEPERYLSVAAKLGAAYTFCKPIDPDDLLSALRAMTTVSVDASPPLG
jgi:DNA-binding response OmpR family regulator